MIRRVVRGITARLAASARGWSSTGVRPLDAGAEPRRPPLVPEPPHRASPAGLAPAVAGALRRTLAALVASWCVLTPARAWPWMVSHGYSGCAECHVDPSGGSVLTSYGRAQGEVLVRMPYGRPVEASDGVERFAWSVPLPDGLQLQPELRGLLLPTPTQVRWIAMQADLKVSVHTDRVVGTASVGVVSEGATGALLTKEDRPVRVVSREHWLGVRPTPSWMVRAGRMNLPFGVRTDEHLLYVRAGSRTDTNDDQQLGVAAMWQDRRARAELMVVLGAYNVAPDAYRERGYSGYAAATVARRVEIGASSLVLHAARGLDGAGPQVRQAHGLFLRGSPAPGVAILAEADALLRTVAGATTPGLVGDVRVDGEVTQGLHLAAGGELCWPAASSPVRGRARASVQWFLAPHVDLRTDVFYGPLACEVGAAAFPAAALQLHVYL